MGGLSVSPDDWDPVSDETRRVDSDAMSSSGSPAVSTDSPVETLEAGRPVVVSDRAVAEPGVAVSDPVEPEVTAGGSSESIVSGVAAGGVAVASPSSTEPSSTESSYVVQAFKVQGSSMSPTLVNGERILVNKFVYSFNFSPIERGDIVVFWYPEDPNLSFIKRVVGLPGEIVEIRGGEVYVDGEPHPELYIAEDKRDSRNLTPREVRPGHYFVLGDNRIGSNDSRSWGFVPKRYIYGQAFLRLWPIRSFGLVE